jgi:hypothetical protein
MYKLFIFKDAAYVLRVAKSLNTMGKNILIAALAFTTIVSAFMWLRPCFTEKSSAVFRFPAIELNGNERITAAEIQFESASIKSIRDIPPGWKFSINLDVPPNPKVRGSITVGAAALESSKKLPSLELDRYIEDVAPTPVRAIFEVQNFSKGLKKPRKVTIELKKK